MREREGKRKKEGKNREIETERDKHRNTERRMSASN